MAALRLVFMGTPGLACTSLEALLQTTEFQVIAVVTQPDRPKGRDLRSTASPVKELARRAGVPVLQPEKARDPAFIEELRRHAPDLIAVAAYGQILPAAILDLPRWGCLNVHTSLLPKYRGAAPIQWAILNGDAETGVTIMKMDVGLDTGPMLNQTRTPIQAGDNAQTLHDRLASLGADLLVQTIHGVVAGTVSPRTQPVEGVTYAPKIKKGDGCLDWLQSSRVLSNRVRGLAPWPGAYTFLPAEPRSRLLKVWQAEAMSFSGHPAEVLQADKTGIIVGCGEDALRILSLQLEGGKRLGAAEFLAGHPLKPGLRLLQG